MCRMGIEESCILFAMFYNMKVSSTLLLTDLKHLRLFYFEKIYPPSDVFRGLRELIRY